MPNPLLTKIVAKHLRQVPEFRPGDTIRVHVKIKEGDKERPAGTLRSCNCPN